MKNFLYSVNFKLLYRKQFLEILSVCSLEKTTQTELSNRPLQVPPLQKNGKKKINIKACEKSARFTLIINNKLLLGNYPNELSGNFMSLFIFFFW